MNITWPRRSCTSLSDSITALRVEMRDVQLHAGGLRRMVELQRLIEKHRIAEDGGDAAHFVLIDAGRRAGDHNLVADFPTGGNRRSVL